MQHPGVRPPDPLVGDRLGYRVGRRVDPGAGDGAEEPHLVPPAPADEPGRDAVQPRPGAGLIRVVTAALAERHQEGLRHQVVGRVPAQPPRDVAVDRRRMPVEHDAETLGSAARLGDQPGIVRLAPLRPRRLVSDLRHITH